MLKDEIGGKILELFWQFLAALYLSLKIAHFAHISL